jgi:hypothetical protein
MTQKNDWLPVDERLVPNIFSFKYPKNKWVRVLLAVEMILSVGAVVGTLILALMPKTATSPKETNAATTTIKATPKPILK